jgi:DtxR family transcriptional regulator, Mn-dependent transcriptional regulator
MRPKVWPSLMPSFSSEPSPIDPRRAQFEDALKHLHEAEYSETPATMASLAGALHVTLARAGELTGQLARSGFAFSTGESIGLSDVGREQARQILRAHRIYETYLAHETGVATEDWHRQADQAEHRLSPEAVDALADRLGRPRFDPHGDPIPTRSGMLPPRRGHPLLDSAVGSHVQVLHMEDEPAVLYGQAAAEGIMPGSRLTVLEKGPDFLRLGVENRVCELPLAAALAIHVEGCEAPPPMRPLSALRNGEAGSILNLSPSIIGGERRRMLDLGLVPGTRIERDFDSMLGSPTAYRVRGATIALRREQADRIFLEV